MTQSDTFKNPDPRTRIDGLLAQIEATCQHAPNLKTYAVAKLLRLPPALKGFHDVINNLQEQLIEQGYFHLDGEKSPRIEPSQIEKVQQTHSVLKDYQLVKADESYQLVSPETDRAVYEVLCYPRFAENSQFWGWKVHFKHHRNPRLDIYLEV